MNEYQPDLVLVAVFASGLAVAGLHQQSSVLDQARQDQSTAYAFVRPSPGIHFSPSAGARYGMEQGCVPHVMTGRPARDFFATAAVSRGQRAEGQYAVTLAVTLQEEDGGACTVVVDRGDPEGLRREMIRVFDAVGAEREVKSDTGPSSTDSNGSFRQELHCLTLDDKPLFLLMSSSSARNRPRLMATLGPDTEGDCRVREAL